jgi:hypothetical protein
MSPTIIRVSFSIESFVYHSRDLNEPNHVSVQSKHGIATVTQGLNIKPVGYLLQCMNIFLFLDSATLNL